MAEETDAKQPPEGGGKQKGNMKPLMFLVVGAVAGGAGAVFMAPPKQLVKVIGPPQPVIEHVELPDLWEFTFNPRVERGFKLAHRSVDAFQQLEPVT